MRSVRWDRVRATEAHGASATLEPSASTGTPPHWEGGGSQLEKWTPAVSAWATTTSAGRWPQGCRHTSTNKADQGKGPLLVEHISNKTTVLWLYSTEEHTYGSAWHKYKGWQMWAQGGHWKNEISLRDIDEKKYLQSDVEITLQGGVFSLPVQ